MLKKFCIIFVVALILNIIWENAHVFLYANYQGGEITEFILLRAALFDALLITIISLPFFYFNFLKSRLWIVILLGLVVAIINEWYGLGTARWAYNDLMPILPIIHTGLTPTLQLALTSFSSIGFVNNKE